MTYPDKDKTTKAIGTLRALAAYYDQQQTDTGDAISEDLDYAADILSTPLNNFLTHLFDQ